MPFKVTASWRLKLLPERLDLETGQMAMSTGRRQFIRARRCGSLAARGRRQQPERMRRIGVLKPRAPTIRNARRIASKLVIS